MTDEATRIRTLNGRFADALEKNQVHWCRARALSALAGMIKHGVLLEVMNETEAVDDPEAFVARLEASLRSTGWIKR